MVSQKVPKPVTPAPHQVRDKLQRGSVNTRIYWLPAFAGMTKTDDFCLFTSSTRIQCEICVSTHQQLVQTPQ